MNADWYRKTTWTKADRERFFRFLGETEENHKSEYLRIQAVYLEKSGNIRYIREAVDLLDILIEKYPDPLQLAQAQLQKATCFEKLALFDQAVESYKESFDAQRLHPAAHTRAVYHFGYFVIRHQKSELYENALEAIHEFYDENDMVFLDNAYRLHASLSIIYEFKKQIYEAVRHAKEALDLLERDRFGLMNNPHFAMELKTDKNVDKKLKKISNGQR